MNTQTHVLLACAVLVPVAASVAVSARSRTKAVTIAALLGALLPDASIFVMFGIAKAQGVTEQVIWQEWYYSDFWQYIGAISNSLPMFAVLAFLAWAAGGRLIGDDYLNAYRPTLALTFSGAAILHVLTDLPLHHDDGHPHFWPISSWIYRSPVSYWDPSHYGHLWSIVEVGLAACFLFVLWRRFNHTIARSLMVLMGSSYVVVSAYWINAFGS